MFFLIFFISLFFIYAQNCLAIVNPLDRANNKIGIHILDPNEVEQVPDLVNSSGGDWGWVTVPIRDDDRDREKWQRFFENCSKNHLIPILRIATAMTKNGWEEPNLLQSIDFANFLNQFNWPTKNRYIIVYNEPNHSSEWGGRIDPAAYAKILKYTSQIFKARSTDFFILPAGLDAAAPNGNTTMNLYNFLGQMVYSEPDVFGYIDGWTSHSYPNPAFSGSPLDTHQQSIVSYRWETDYVRQFTGKDLAVFITETGWQDNRIGQNNSAEFYKIAFNSVWKDSDLVAITPFLFNAQGPFSGFSFFNSDSSKKPSYLALKTEPKINGNPDTSASVILGASDTKKAVSLPSIQPDAQLVLAAQSWHKIYKWIENIGFLGHN